MSVPFHMSAEAISRLLSKAFKVLWDVLQPLELQLPSEEQWKNIAKRFGDLWDYPFAFDSLDRKHISLKKPGNSGSMFYNYKRFPSIVLMALSDADSCFILVDCGHYGRVSDAGVYQSSHMSTLLEEGNLNIPKQAFKINGSVIEVPYMVIGDEAFPLKTYLMKPFAVRTLNEKRRIYDYRHSRARRLVECTLGILTRKFEIFQRPMRVEPDKAIIITNAAIGLHNFIRRRDAQKSSNATNRYGCDVLHMEGATINCCVHFDLSRVRRVVCCMLRAVCLLRRVNLR
ncbi:hypothetical protein RRG08_048314 [Elysia crispata]|uniref:DDE Tnp4 domain-containing protein n=1 Tax=Elysia crispata TaxID=231223 RepID=A0AAE0ZTF3_9GAST|nr:hypothetical protein RRG08_048314 [Elysia crispata]